MEKKPSLAFSSGRLPLMYGAPSCLVQIGTDQQTLINHCVNILLLFYSITAPATNYSSSALKKKERKKKIKNQAQLRGENQPSNGGLAVAGVILSVANNELSSKFQAHMVCPFLEGEERWEHIGDERVPLIALVSSVGVFVGSKNKKQEAKFVETRKNLDTCRQHAERDAPSRIAETIVHSAA